MLYYKFVSYAEWERDYKELYPCARSNSKQTEVVLSFSEGGGDLTRAQAQEYIKTNWTGEEDEPNDTE